MLKPFGKRRKTNMTNIKGKVQVTNLLPKPFRGKGAVSRAQNLRGRFRFLFSFEFIGVIQ